MLSIYHFTVYEYHHRPELAAVGGLKGCVKGFQFQKKDFNLLEEPGTIGISSGCPEESFVSSAPYSMLNQLPVKHLVEIWLVAQVFNSLY